MVKILNRGGVLLIYCIRGKSNSSVIQAKSQAGPPDEREIMRAIKLYKVAKSSFLIEKTIISK